MLLQKQGYPEEGEFVLCTVTAVHQNSVFVILDEYKKTGLIHISEVSPGRIRNIRDFVVEGKKIVCLVLNINTEKGHIDLSLRRVNDNQKRNKVNQIKQEQKAEKIVEYVAKKLDVGLTLLYKEIYEKISNKYGYLSIFFEELVAGNAKITELELDKEKAGVLSEVIMDRIKPPHVQVRSELKLKTYDPNGVEIIKKAFEKALSSQPQVDVKYEGGGRYKLKLIASDHKEAEKILDEFENIVTAMMGKKKEAVLFEKNI
ncbi:MAG: S1 RNA-binding domain-containing protein [Nanoarchaeota archaeon]